jgi:hypothetical protein
LSADTRATAAAARAKSPIACYVSIKLESSVGMAKVVVANLKSKLKTEGRGRTSVSEQRVRDTDGQVKTLRKLDARASTFGGDLQQVFGKNVAKARRDNKRTTGATDVAVSKR